MGLSIWHVLVLLVVVILLFGTSRIKSLGKDLGTALKDFRQSVGEDNPNSQPSTVQSKNLNEGQTNKTLN